MHGGVNSSQILSLEAQAFSWTVWDFCFGTIGSQGSSDRVCSRPCRWFHSREWRVFQRTASLITLTGSSHVSKGLTFTIWQTANSQDQAPWQRMGADFHPPSCSDALVWRLVLLTLDVFTDHCCSGAWEECKPCKTGTLALVLAKGMLLMTVDNSIFVKGRALYRTSWLPQLNISPTPHFRKCKNVSISLDLFYLFATNQSCGLWEQTLVFSQHWVHWPTLSSQCVPMPLVCTNPLLNLNLFQKESAAKGTQEPAPWGWLGEHHWQRQHRHRGLLSVEATGAGLCGGCLCPWTHCVLTPINEHGWNVNVCNRGF